nr:hypothetical protein CFP56_76549 [Quercus suber]
MFVASFKRFEASGVAAKGRHIGALGRQLYTVSLQQQSAVPLPPWPTSSKIGRYAIPMHVRPYTAQRGLGHISGTSRGCMANPYAAFFLSFRNAQHGKTFDECSQPLMLSKAFFFEHFEHYLINKADDLKCICCDAAFRFRRKATSMSRMLHEGLRAVKDLLDLASFRRLWMLQENAVAKFSVLHFGQHRVTWDILAVATTAYDEYAHCESPFTTKECEVFHRAEGNRSVVAQDCAMTEAARRTKCLLNVMIFTWNFESRFVKDCLNCIRALACIEHEAAFQLDIDLHISAFWLRVACFLLAKQRPRSQINPYFCRSFLLTLPGLQYGRKDPLLPPWVPDMAILDRESYQRFYYSLVNCQSNRARGPRRRFPADPTGVPDVLFVRSIYLCKIAETLPGIQYPPSSND